MSPPNESEVVECSHCHAIADRSRRICSYCGASLKDAKPIDQPEPIAGPPRSSLNAAMTVKIAAAVIIAVVCMYFTYRLAFSAGRAAQVQTATASGDPIKAGVSDQNRDVAKAALNAVGEIDSVTSVGTNYLQYTSAVQSARIKYDAAVRNLKPGDDGDAAFFGKLETAFACYQDASNAWNAFINYGDNGFLSETNSTMRSLAVRYDFGSPGEFGYYRATVMQAIWAKADSSFEEASRSLQP